MIEKKCLQGATDRHVWGLPISWQNRLTLYLGLDHFMTKQTDTMSEVRPFHDKTDWYYIWGSTISWQNRPIQCLELDHFITKHTDTTFLYVWGLTISLQNRLTLCLRLDHFVTKQTDTMSGAWPVSDSSITVT